MNHLSSTDSQKIWTLFKKKTLGQDFHGYLTYFLNKFSDDISTIDTSQFNIQPFKHLQSFQFNRGSNAIRLDILVNQGFVGFLKSRRVTNVLVMNSMTISDLVDLHGQPNAQRDILYLSTFELVNIEFGKHYLPDVVFAAPNLEWALLLDADDSFHVASTPEFAQEFATFMTRFLQPYLSNTIR